MIQYFGLFSIISVLLISGCVQEEQTKVCEGSGVVIDISERCPEYWCGDGSCLSIQESCESCPQDCGQCPPDEMSNFDVTSLTCDNILPELRVTIKNTRYETVTVKEVQLWSTESIPRSQLQYPNRGLAPGGQATLIFPFACDSGQELMIEVTYTDSEGSHKDRGASYFVE